MSGQTVPEPVIVEANAGRRLAFAGNEVTFKLTGNESGGAFSVIEYSVAPNFVAPPVLHANTLEAWAGYVLEGTLGFEFEETSRVIAGKGTFLFLPKSTMFRWWNETDQAARWLCIYSPAGFENYFTEVSAVIADVPRENFDIKQAMPRIMPLWEKYGIK